MSLSSFFRRSRRVQKTRRANHWQTTRRPRFETLEDRQLLSITVNTLTDELDGSIVDGDISLRDAIAAAPVGETIDFSVTGAIDLALGQLTIGKNLTVTGPGANQLTIDAGGASRVLEITAGTVGLSGLTLTGGNGGGEYGGGVLNAANTTLTGVVIQGNTGAYVGGGASNAGTLTIVDSTISGNSASWGGGVFNANSLTIENSTISGNSADDGGGVFSYDYDTSTTISNSTISGNSASSLGGGIATWNITDTSLSHTLVTGNSAPTGSEIFSQGGAVNLSAFNLIGDSSETTAQALVGVTAGASDILATSNGTNPTALAAILNPLANNGGPTKTQALVAGSPAIDAGNPTAVAGSGGVPLYDQRGDNFGRVQNGRIDIGAFEARFQPPPPGSVSISVSDASVAEGNRGVKFLTFTVSLSVASTGPVTVNYATQNGSATAGSDYQAETGTLSFASGETTKTVRIAIFGDRTVESDESLQLVLSNATGKAVISDPLGVGLILNDDVVHGHGKKKK